MNWLKKLGVKFGAGKVVDYFETKGWSRAEERKGVLGFFKAFIDTLLGLDDRDSTRRPGEEEPPPPKSKKPRSRNRRSPFRK